MWTKETAKTGDKSKDAVISLVKQILKIRFSDNIIKQQIDSTDGKKLNFACPICGDSQKKSSKKRGNIFFKSRTYKCFNDGCMAFMSLRKFVSLFARKYNITPNLDVFDEPTVIKHRDSSNTLIRFLLSDREQIVSISDIINRFGLTRSDELPEDSRVRKELVRRCIHLTEDYGDLIYGDRMDDKFYIFNLDLKSGKILGFALRKLDTNAAQKYIIKTYTDILTAYPNSQIDKQVVDDCIELGNYFNILNLDFSEPMTITEGQIDSMFVRNCLSTTGVSKAMSILDSLGDRKNIRILFDRDKAGKVEMMKLIQQGYRVFLWNMLIVDLKKRFKKPEDSLDLTPSKMKDINDLFKFFHKRIPTTNLDSFNELLDKYFSTSIYDIAFV